LNSAIVQAGAHRLQLVMGTPAAGERRGHRRQQDRARAVAHQVHLRARGIQLLHVVDHEVGRAPDLLAASAFSFISSQAALAGQRARQRLQRVVQAIEHEVLGGVERAFRAAAAHRVLQDVLDGRSSSRCAR
jgi:hypothetical protein